MFKPRLRIPRVGLPRQRLAIRRSLHSVPTLSVPGVSVNGIPGLLTPDGFDLAYTQYMQFVTEKLNALTAGTHLEHQTTLQIIRETAREPSQAPIFNYASMAHNNHFFFENLSEKEEPVPIPDQLKRALEDSFSSIETLKREMVMTANAMFGPGFVWLVKSHKANNFRILTTYLAGSPYAEAHWRRQGSDSNTQPGPSSNDNTGSTIEFLARTQLGAGADNGSAWLKTAPGGIEVIPLLCVNTWEHVWLRDYGIGAGGYGGKRLFIDNWWNHIDWHKVMDAAKLHRGALKI